MKPNETNKLLCQQVVNICQMLLSGGKVQGNYFVAGNIHGEAGESLKVHLSGSKLGKFTDYASPENHGDLVDLWAQSKGITITEANQEAQKYLGIDTKKDFYKFKKKEFKPPEKPKCKVVTSESTIGSWYNQTRLISAETLKAYKIGIKDDKVIFPYFFNDKLMMYKTRDMGKEWSDPNGKKYTPTNKDPHKCLFGWQAIPDKARAVCIVEGENDVLACYEQQIPALSVPFGGGGGNKQQSWIENEFENLERFDRIYLMLDMDEQGEAAKKEILSALGRHNCWIVDLPKKDAGDCHMAGIDIMPFIKNAKTIDPEELKNSSEFKDDVFNEFYRPDKETMGLKMPWATTFNKLRFRPSEVTIWTGFNGAGKSQVLGQMFVDFISQRERVCIASMEMKPKKLIKRMMRQISGYQTPPEPMFENINDWLSSGLWLFNVKGTAKTEKIFEVFKYARMRYGIKQFLIDSLAKCGIGGEDLDGQKKFIDRCCEMADELDSHIHIVAHSKKKEDEDKMPGKMDVKGSGDLTDMVDNVVTIWRNKKKEKKIERLKLQGETIPDYVKSDKDCVLFCSKQRHEDWEGAIALWFDRISYQYRDNIENPLKQYIPK